MPEAEQLEATGVVRIRARRLGTTTRFGETHQPRLLRVQAQAVLAESLRQHLQHPTSIHFRLENDHEVVRVAHEVRPASQPGLHLSLKPRVQAERSSNRGFFLCGVFAGLSSGLFGMAGPPAIYHLYRQPMEIASIRCMLLLVFAFTASARTLFVATQGGLSTEVWLLTAFAVLLVALASYAGRRFPPPFSATTMRRIAFGTLLVIGLSLMITAVS